MTQSLENEFVDISSSPSKVLDKKRETLESLGPDRPTLTEQRAFLKGIVRAYQGPKDMCLNGASKFGSFPTSMLQGLAALKRHDFRLLLKKEGASRPFQTPTMEIDDAAHEAAGSLDYEKTRNIYTWINHRYQGMKWSTVPGLIPPTLIDQLFDEQTTAWVTVTQSFTDRIKDLFMASIRQCLDMACHNPQVVKTLHSHLLDTLAQKVADFRDFCTDLRQNELDGVHELAGEEQFIKEMQQARTMRLIQALARVEIGPLSSVAEVSMSTNGPSSGPPAAGTSTPNATGNGNLEPTSADNITATKATEKLFGYGISGPSSFGDLKKGPEGKSIFSSSEACENTTPLNAVPVNQSPHPVAATPTKPRTNAVKQTPLYPTGHTLMINDIPAPKFGEPSVPISPFAYMSLGQKSVTGNSKPFVDETTRPQPSAPSVPSKVPSSSLAILAKQNFSGLQEALSDNRQIVYEIHDILKAYYDISVQHYADAVCKTALNKRYIREVMDVFCDEWVGALSDDQVRTIVGDSESRGETQG